jgi:CRP/FNR family transcriptional regulator
MRSDYSSRARSEPARAQVACRDCSVFQLCLPVGAGETDLALLDHIAKRRHPLRRGNCLFRLNDPFSSVYAVTSGSIKTFVPVDSGPDQVTGFYLPGELLGLDAMNAGRYRCSARALEASSVCEIPLDRLEELGQAVGSVQRQMLRIMSRKIFDDQVLQILLCKKNGEQRLAAFLLSLSERFQQRGFSPVEFKLSMPRDDIGSFLGMAQETVCRLFTRFQTQGYIKVNRKFVTIRDLTGLRGLVGVPKLN